MIKIGLLSDTHCYVHPKIYDFFADCNEIWHAGDIGDIATADELNAFKPLKAVYGNIDGHIVRSTYPESLIFNCENVKVYMTHIGGYPDRYAKQVKDIIKLETPNLFISGHSHILKVMYDQKHELLHINPGAAGRSGFHQVITLIRFCIDGINIKDLEIIELNK
ncbi:MAG: metallophosphoesterase family protein [Bacteroidota bacterium]